MSRSTESPASRDFRLLVYAAIAIWAVLMAFAGNWMWRAYIWHHVSDLLEDRYGLVPVEREVSS